MLPDIPLLTVLYFVCYFIGKGPRNVFSTTITRAGKDIFTARCGSCHKFGATCQTSGVNVCQCRQSTKDFLRFKKSCESGDQLRLKEYCFHWTDPQVLQVIDTEGSLSYYTYWREVKYNSCSVQSVFYLDNRGLWVLMSLPPEVLETVDKAPQRPVLKVTGNSPDLVKYKGYVMKVTLRCQRRDFGEEKRCLVFKTKGNLKFQLFNSTTTPLTSCSSVIQTTPTLSSPSMYMTSDSKGASVASISTTTATAGASLPLQTQSRSTLSLGIPRVRQGERDTTDIFVTLIATIGAILCVIIICAVVWAVYRYKYRSRALEARNYDNPERVINNTHPQNFTLKEEPLYVELPEILPSCQSKADNRVFNGGLEMFAVACNPSVKEASLSRSRKFTDPLPSRPMHRQSAKLDEGLRINDENDAVQSVKEEPDGSVVLRNPHASCTNHAPTRSLSRGEDPSITCVGQRDANNEVRGQAIEREINDPDIYQGLDQGRRPKSIFVCSSCSDSTVYQRLSGERCCSHQPNDTNEGKRQSVYASLSLERSSRDSVYAPLGTGVAVEENQEKQAEETDACDDPAPVYHVLEPGVSESTSEPDGPDPALDFDQAYINHEYNVLEEEGEGETTSYDRDGDKKYEALCRHVPPFQPLEYLALERAPSPMVPRKTNATEGLTLRPRSSSA